jgi:hypothetical protein
VVGGPALGILERAYGLGRARRARVRRLGTISSLQHREERELVRLRVPDRRGLAHPWHPAREKPKQLIPSPFERGRVPAASGSVHPPSRHSRETCPREGGEREFTNNGRSPVGDGRLRRSTGIHPARYDIQQCLPTGPTAAGAASARALLSNYGFLPSTTGRADRKSGRGATVEVEDLRR